MIKSLIACAIVAGFSTSAFSQSKLPPDVEASYQKKADEFYQVSMDSCQPLAGSPFMQRCVDDAAKGRARFMLNAERIYWSNRVADNSKKRFQDTAEKCRLDSSRTCSDAMQTDAEQYFDDSVEARRAALAR